MSRSNPPPRRPRRWLAFVLMAVLLLSVGLMVSEGADEAAGEASAAASPSPCALTLCKLTQVGARALLR